MVQAWAGKNVCITACISSEALDYPSFTGLLLFFLFLREVMFWFHSYISSKVYF